MGEAIEQRTNLAPGVPRIVRHALGSRVAERARDGVVPIATVLKILDESGLPARHPLRAALNRDLNGERSPETIYRVAAAQGFPLRAADEPSNVVQSPFPGAGAAAERQGQPTPAVEAPEAQRSDPDPAGPGAQAPGVPDERSRWTYTPVAEYEEGGHKRTQWGTRRLFDGHLNVDQLREMSGRAVSVTKRNGNENGEALGDVVRAVHYSDGTLATFAIPGKSAAAGPPIVEDKRHLSSGDDAPPSRRPEPGPEVRPPAASPIPPPPMPSSREGGGGPGGLGLNLFGGRDPQYRTAKREWQRNRTRAALAAKAHELSALSPEAKGDEVFDVKGLGKTRRDMRQVTMALQDARERQLRTGKTDPKRTEALRKKLASLTDDLGRHHRGVSDAVASGAISRPGEIKKLHRSSQRARKALLDARAANQDLAGTSPEDERFRHRIEQAAREMARQIAALLQRLIGMLRGRSPKAAAPAGPGM